jgi:hypothetical protein
MFPAVIDPRKGVPRGSSGGNMDYTFEELRAVCKSIRSRTGEGDRIPEITGRSEAQVEDLLASLHEAGSALARMAYLLMTGGRIGIKVRTDAEMDAVEALDRWPKGVDAKQTATADDLPEFFGEDAQ